VGTFVPTPAGGPLGGRRGAARRPQSDVEAISATAAPPRMRQTHDREGVVPLGPCAAKVALPSDGPRVSCLRVGGGKSLRRVGYELPHAPT